MRSRARPASPGRGASGPPVARPGVNSASLQPSSAPCARDGQYLVRCPGTGVRPVRDGREGAVAAAIPAQPGQRDEDLARVGDDPGPFRGLQAGVAGAAGVGQQGLQVLAAGVQQDRRLVQVERLAVPGPGQGPAHGRGGRRVGRPGARAGSDRPTGPADFAGPAGLSVLPRPVYLTDTRVAAENTHARTLRGKRLPLARPPAAAQAGTTASRADTGNPVTMAGVAAAELLHMLRAEAPGVIGGNPGSCAVPGTHRRPISGRADG